MKLYTNTELIASWVGNKDFTTGSLTRGITVLNFSNTSFLVETTTKGQLGVVPPYFARTFNCQNNEFVQVIPTSDDKTAISQPNMFVDIEELQGSVVPSTVALAQVPGYVMTIDGSTMIKLDPSSSVVVSSLPSVVINSLPSVTINNIVTIKTIPDEIIYFNTLLDMLLNNVIVMPSPTKVIKELRFDVINSGSHDQNISCYLGLQSSAHYLSSVAIKAGTSTSIDLKFGNNGVPFDNGFYGLCDFINEITVKGYAITSSK